MYVETYETSSYVLLSCLSLQFVEHLPNFWLEIRKLSLSNLFQSFQIYNFIGTSKIVYVIAQEARQQRENENLCK